MDKNAPVSFKQSDAAQQLGAVSRTKNTDTFSTPPPHPKSKVGKQASSTPRPALGGMTPPPFRNQHSSSQAITSTPCREQQKIPEDDVQNRHEKFQVFLFCIAILVLGIALMIGLARLFPEQAEWVKRNPRSIVGFSVLLGLFSKNCRN